MNMPFGMHRGKPLERIPTAYLAWLWNECDLMPRLRAAVESELRQRTEGDGATGAIEPHEESIPLADVRIALKTWYWEAARQFHPDRTLDNGKVMSAINASYARLQELLGVSR